MIRYSQQELLEKIIQLAKLPKSKKTKFFLSKSQLIALYLYLTKTEEAISQLKKREIINVND